jgi:hypothetical protein
MRILFVIEAFLGFAPPLKHCFQSLETRFALET